MERFFRRSKPTVHPLGTNVFDLLKTVKDTASCVQNLVESQQTVESPAVPELTAPPEDPVSGELRRVKAQSNDPAPEE